MDKGGSMDKEMEMYSVPAERSLVESTSERTPVVKIQIQEQTIRDRTVKPRFDRIFLCTKLGCVFLFIGV